MKKNTYRGKQKMSKYLSNNYVGSILERASYKKNEIRPYKIRGSLMERKIKTKADNNIWQRLKKSMSK